jgi:hypothetical protein
VGEKNKKRQKILWMKLSQKIEKDMKSGCKSLHRITQITNKQPS